MTLIHKRFENLRNVRKWKDVTSLTFASSKSLWEGYAYMLADYYYNEYERNTKYLFNKLNELDKVEKYNKLQKDEAAVLVSLIKLRSNIQEDKRASLIDFTWENIPRDFFEVKNTDEIYSILIQESDEQTGQSISYLLKLYNVLISFILNKKTRMAFYDSVVLEEAKIKKIDEHPIIITEDVIKSMATTSYLHTDFKKKKKYWENEN